MDSITKLIARFEDGLQFAPSMLSRPASHLVWLYPYPRTKPPLLRNVELCSLFVLSVKNAQLQKFPNYLTDAYLNSILKYTDIIYRFYSLAEKPQDVIWDKSLTLPLVIKFLTPVPVAVLGKYITIHLL